MHLNLCCMFCFQVQTITLVEAGRDYIGAAAISGWGFDSRIGIGKK